MDEYGKFCTLVAKQEGVEYVLKSKQMEYDQVFSSDGLLPAVMKRAEMLSSLCFGQSSDPKYTDNDNAVLGVEVTMGKPVLSMQMRFCLLDTLLEIHRGVKNGRVALDELLYD